MDKFLSAKETDELDVLGFDLHNAPGHLLRRCHQHSREIFNQHMGDKGLSRQLLSVLISIYQNPAETYTVLSTISGFDRNTLAEMIDRLVQQKLATRKRSEKDARAYSVELTDKGKKLVRSVMQKAKLVQEQLLEPLPEALRPVFMQCMRIMLDLEKA